MATRQSRPRVRLTYPIAPVRRMGLGVNEQFESDDPADATIWGNAIAEVVRGRVRHNVRSEEVLIIELSTPTAPRYRALLETAVLGAVNASVGHLFASVHCEVQD